ncbi:MAG: 50S ribosomal protein L29 [Candidatus Omnitrophica bacterium]|nr:50S ribosomal protein L29 [Candidatus Omnitrophota bacterium]
MADRRPRTKELRALAPADLQAQLEKLRQELWQHRVKATQGSLTQVHLIGAMRRQMARVQTVLREQRRPSAESPQG